MSLYNLGKLLDAGIDRGAFVGLWLLVSAVILFGSTYARDRHHDPGFLSWISRIGRALFHSFGLVLIVGIAYFLVNSGYRTYNNIYGSFDKRGTLSNLNLQKWNSLYGDQFNQADLSVDQYYTEERMEIIQSDDPTIPPETRIIRNEIRIQQNSITRFRGLVILTSLDEAPPSSRINAFSIDAFYEYDIVNPAEKDTRILYRFPIDTNTILYRDLLILANGKPVQSYRLMPNAITWEGQLGPGEKVQISIQYQASGMEWYIFSIDNQREIVDFEFTIRGATTDQCIPSVTPDNGSVQFDYRVEGSQGLYTWTIDHAIIAPKIRMHFLQFWPYAPYRTLTDFLLYTSRAMVYFISLLVLSLTILDYQIQPKQIAMLAFLFCAPHLFMMSGVAQIINTGQFNAPAQVTQLLPIVIIVFWLSRLILVRQFRVSPKQVILVLSLMLLFMIAYPLTGLFTLKSDRNIAEGIVQVVMILYVLVLALAKQFRRNNENKGSDIESHR